MNILVFSGSPKGEKSVTMQYIKWLMQNEPEHQIEVVHVAQQIKWLEKNRQVMDEIMKKVVKADGILWAFPLYVAMPHAGVKRFVELLNDPEKKNAFRGKHAAILTTSIHFFDHTAVEYMRGVSEDLGMVLDEVYASGMHNLLEADGAKQLKLFFKKWTYCIKCGVIRQRVTAPVVYSSATYTYTDAKPISKQLKVAIVTESGVNVNLDRMVERISKEFSETDIFDLSTMNIAGNCIGCLRCAYSNTCIYEGRDDIIDTYRRLNDYDALLFCGFIVDRYFSSRWKTFVDRMFFSTHTPALPGKPIGFIAAGPLNQLSNFREILNGVYGSFQMPIAGMVSDEGDHIDDNLIALADSLCFMAKEGYAAPDQFPAICGRKVFRDEIFAGLGGIFRADYQYYSKNGWFDLPHKKVGDRIKGMVLRMITKNVFIRKNMQENMRDHMLLPFQKIVK